MRVRRHHLEAVALLLIAVAVALGVVGVTRSVHATAPPVAPQQAPQAKVIASAPVPASTKAQDSLPCPPPPGEGVLGACTPKPVQVYGATSLSPADPSKPASIPDVSSWQGNVNWSAVVAWQRQHGYAPAGIFKMGEYVIDPYAYRNNSQLRSLGAWRAGYWFVRNTGCAHEASQIITEARYLQLRVVELDDEVPEARGYDGCLTPALKAAGFVVGEYASPGAYPGGTRSSNPAWIAAYGPFNPPAAPWGGPIVAYQCTDGVFGCVTYVPGIGRGDVSVDFGITREGAAPVAANAPGCNNPSPWHSLCLARFPSVVVTNGVRGGWCSKGCVERQVVRSYQYDRAHSLAGAARNDQQRLAWLHYRLAWLTQHRTLAQNKADYDYGRLKEQQVRVAGAFKSSWNAYLAAG